MISYALAKQLMDAGWEQPDMTRNQAGQFLASPDRSETVEHLLSGSAYAPSLSELIEKCPRTIETSYYGRDVVGRFSLMVPPRDQDGWTASYYNDFDGHLAGFIQMGLSPEETVAEFLLLPTVKPLWLKLQEGK